MDINNAGFYKNPYGEFDFNGGYKTDDSWQVHTYQDEEISYSEYVKEIGGLTYAYCEADNDGDGKIDKITRCVADCSDAMKPRTLSSEVCIFGKDGEDFSKHFISNIYENDIDGNPLKSYRTIKYDSNGDNEFDSVEQYEYRGCNYDTLYSYAKYQDIDFDGTTDFQHEILANEDGDIIRSVSNNSNKYHNSDTYTVTWQGAVATIKNEKTKAEISCDFSKRIEDVTDSDKEPLLRKLQEMTGEGLFDIANEDMFDTCTAEDHRSYYYSGSDKIYMDSKAINQRTITHETGHAVDFGAYDYNLPSSRKGEFLKTYNEELQNYIAEGNEVWREEVDPETGLSVITNEVTGAYCTSNEREMFAEAYELIMLGDSDSKEVIEKYFPKTFELVKSTVEEKRAENLEKYRPVGLFEKIKNGFVSAVEKVADVVVTVAEGVLDLFCIRAS